MSEEWKEEWNTDLVEDPVKRELDGSEWIFMLKNLIYQQTSIAPLAVFRALFGLMMLVSIIRFAYNGWIYDLYIAPKFFFTYYGFEWVKPLGEIGMYAIFLVMGVAALFVALGLFYRIAIVLFFLTFTYVELIDVTNYLNHYYFVSIVSFLLIFVPANRAFSLDVWRNSSSKLTEVPVWTINIFKFQLGIIYVYAGISKLNPDWLFLAMPLKIWLPSQSHIPVIGYLLNFQWVAYAFSWGGAFYDLFIVFFLIYKPTRIFAYATVIFFHGMTALLFQIGMFPYIMMVLTLLYFPASFHEKLIKHTLRLCDFTRTFIFAHKIAKLQRKKEETQTGLQTLSTLQFTQNEKQTSLTQRFQKPILLLLSIHLFIQIILPFRFVLYPDHLFWTEEGYRFSWRVMLMEKAGYTVFNVSDPSTGKKEQVNNMDYLTLNQEKMMGTQPDMILQFAHFLEREYRKKGFENPEIRAESYVTLNGRRSRPFINPEVDLTKEKEGFHHKKWVLPFEE